MDLRIYSPSLSLLATVDTYQSLRWRRKYFEPGEFEIHCNSKWLDVLNVGNYVYRTGAKESGIIESVQLSGNETTVTGRFLLSILSRRIIPQLTNITGAVELSMRSLVQSNAMAGVRAIPHLKLGAINSYAPTAAAQTSGKGLLYVLGALSKCSNIGCRIELDVPNKSLAFCTYCGVDHSTAQNANSKVVFNDKFENIASPVYSEDDTTYKNFAYVIGKNAADADIVVTVDQSLKDDRREIYVDASSTKQEAGMSDANFKALLYQAGSDALFNQQTVQNFECETIGNQFKYRTHWDLGDVVTIEKWNIKINARITEIEEIYENGTVKIMPVFGTPYPENLDLEG